MYIFMDYLPAWMFVVLFGLLLIGYPVAFTNCRKLMSSVSLFTQ